MGVGIVHDVAVGVSPAGADAWAYQDVMATHGHRRRARRTRTPRRGRTGSSRRGVPTGWPQPATPRSATCSRTALRHCGGLRVDHIIGLFRLWWIPRRPAGARGHLRPLRPRRADRHPGPRGPAGRRRAHRRGPRQRRAVGRAATCANAACSARPSCGSRTTPTTARCRRERWRELCLASVTTHDLPPTAGYLAGDHVRLRDELGLLTRAVDEELAVSAARSSQAWLDELRARAACCRWTAATPATEQFVLALHRFLTPTPSLLRCVALTDAVGDRRTQNQPGTTGRVPELAPAAGGTGRRADAARAGRRGPPRGPPPRGDGRAESGQLSAGRRAARVRVGSLGVE